MQKLKKTMREKKIKIDSRIDKVLEWHDFTNNECKTKKKTTTNERKNKNHKNAVNAKAFTSNYVAKKPDNIQINFNIAAES